MIQTKSSDIELVVGHEETWVGIVLMQLCISEDNKDNRFIQTPYSTYSLRRAIILIFGSFDFWIL